MIQIALHLTRFHLQLNTTHCFATALLRSFVVSVLPVPAKLLKHFVAAKKSNFLAGKDGCVSAGKGVM
jgi:hypothetical protein